MHRISVWTLASALAVASQATCQLGKQAGNSPAFGGSAKSAACRTEVLEGEVAFGKGFAQPIGNGLSLLLQPIHSGWILRVLPSATPPAQIGAQDQFDYAEIATPPYQSVTPLSISTDFALRAQDAVGWNPRRFHFAADAGAFARMAAAYAAFAKGGAGKAVAERALAAGVARAPEGLFTVLDSRLVPGAADQSGVASAVSANFTGTAHLLDLPSPGQATPLGRIEWLRFRVELELPGGFQAFPGLKIVPHVCGTR